MTALLVSVLLAMLGGVAMSLAFTETVATGQHRQESASRSLAESGVEQVVAWFTHGALPARVVPVQCTGTPDAPNVEYDAGRPDDDRLLNDPSTGTFRTLADLGRIAHLRLYGPARPEGFCTVQVTAESKGRVRQTVSLELGAIRIPPLREAVQAGPPSPWAYRTFKELALRFGVYYVPDREGRLYRYGQRTPELAQTPTQAFGSSATDAPRGLVFIDTLDQAPPSADNLATLIVDSPYMEGVFYVNAHVVLRPGGVGPADGRFSVQGVLHTAGSLHVEQPTRVYGAVVAEGGLTGDGLLNVQYNDDLGRGRVQGLPVVFPIPGTWHEWGS